MRIAVATSEGLLARHFGHCEQFVFFDVEETGKTIQSSRQEAAPPHAHGVLPRWLQERGATVVIAGGMGPGARALLEQADIQVVAGVESLSPGAAVAGYLAGTLAAGENRCDHTSHEHGRCC